MTNYEYAKLVKIRVPDRHRRGHGEQEAHELGIVDEFDVVDRVISRTTYYRLSTGKFVSIRLSNWDLNNGGFLDRGGEYMAFSQLPQAIKIGVRKREYVNATITKKEDDEK